jgi:beta-glucosidase
MPSPRPVPPLTFRAVARFPKNFVWGTAAAAPQIEGAAFEDGKGESVWDHYARIPGWIAQGDTLDVACDHYHRFKDDFALMRKLGIRHYRLSLAWPRIFPTGRGALNRKGLDFYDRLIDALLDAGITPWVTMFHWDHPQAMEDIGGWRNRAMPEAFATYADTIVRAYGDRVKRWMTLNEMRCFTLLAYGLGERPPGLKEPDQVVNQSFHHALLAHGHGVRAVREHGGRGAQVGLADDTRITIPVTELPADIAAARAAFIEMNVRSLDPIFRGGYNADYRRVTRRDGAKPQRGDGALITQPVDFLGLNAYTGCFVRAGVHGRPEVVELPRNYPRADPWWQFLMPQVMYWGPRWAHEIYRVKAIYITENGAGYEEEPTASGEINDLHRREYVRQCLWELHRAHRDGVPVRGYFLWSFMDNFEWREGYDLRFGLCRTDYTTQKRTPKLSARWYAQVMKHGRVL